MRKYNSAIFYTLPAFDCTILNEWVKIQRPGYANYGILKSWSEFQNITSSTVIHWSLVIDAGAQIKPHNLVFKTLGLQSKFFVVIPKNFFDMCIVDTIRVLNERDSVLVPKPYYTSPYMYLLYEQIFSNNFFPNFWEKINNIAQLISENNIKLVYPPNDNDIHNTPYNHIWATDIVYKAFKDKYEIEFYEKQKTLVDDWNHFCRDLLPLSTEDFNDIQIIGRND